MKLKFINLLLASVLLVGSAQVFTSCKDNEADLYVNLKEETLSLSEKLEADGQLLTELQKKLNEEIAEREDQAKELDESIKGLTKDVADLSKDLEEAQQGNKDNADVIADLQKQITANLEAIKTNTQALAKVNGDITTLNESLTTLEEAQKNYQSLVDGKLEEINGNIGAILEEIGDINGSIGEINGSIAAIKEFNDGILGRLVVVEEGLSEAQANILLLNEDVTGLKEYVTTWSTWIELIPNINDTANSALETATAANAQANKNATDIEALQQTVGDVYEELLGLIRERATIDQVETYRNELQEQINDLSDRIEEVRAEAYANYRASLKFTMMTCGALRLLINENTAKIAELTEAINGLVTSDQLNALAQELNQKVEKNAQDIAALTTKVDELTNRVAELAERVNGVIIQQVDNKVFGTFNTPVGINSNMLLGWWGQVENSRGVEFPTADTGYGYKSGEQYIGLTEQDLVNLGITPEEFDGKKYLMETNEAGEGVLGTIYMTVNPSNANLDGKTFSIVNSLGKATPITINPVASNHELTFGYTRGGTDNGFYEAQATIDISNNVAIDAVKFTLNDNLRSTVASIIKEGRSSINATTIAKLGKALYSQVNGILPALAVSCSWDDSEQGAMQVTSNYSLAAAAIHAPSLSVLNPFDNSGKHIPNVPDISGIQDRFNTWYDDLKGRIHIDLGLGTFNITLDDVEIKINDVKVSLQDVDKTVSGTGGATTDATIVGYQLKVNVKNASDDVVGTVDQWIEIPIKPISATASVTVDLTTLLNQMETAVNSALNDVLNGPSGVAADMTAQINKELGKVADKISTEVNSLFSTMQTNIDTQISTILNGIQSDVNGKLESVLGTVSNVSDRVQSLINRLNDVLTEPSHYIQPVLLYKAGSKVGIFSTSAAVPSQFVIASGNTAGVYVIPTTYTLESVVPLYKKFVAVTKVWANGDASKTNVASVMNDANNQGKMNKVLDPKNTLVGLKIQKGYTYEIAYQGMGYDGKVSGRKYYVTVK